MSSPLRQVPRKKLDTQWGRHTPTHSFPSRGCVVIMMEGRIRAEQTVRLLSFRMRSFRGMGNGASCKCNLFMGLQPGGWPIKGFRSKALSPDRLFRFAMQGVPL